MVLPNFLIVGAARCGTTALYHILKQHPQVSMPNLKEPRFFSSQNLQFPQNGRGDDSIDKAVIKNEPEYKNLFSSISNERVGEASPDYLFYHSFTADKIYSYLGDVEIIILLRNPVDRAYSAYNHLLRDNRETLSFEEALKVEEDRKKSNYDFMWLYKEVSLYYEQVKTFKEKFSNVHILLQEELEKDPIEEVSKVVRFLSLSSDFEYNPNINYNSAGKPSNLFSKIILDRSNSLSLLMRETAKKMIPRSMLEVISGKMIGNKEDMKARVRNHLVDYYEHNVKKLDKLIDNDLSIWFE